MVIRLPYEMPPWLTSIKENKHQGLCREWCHRANLTRIGGPLYANCKDYVSALRFPFHLIVKIGADEMSFSKGSCYNTTRIE